MEAIKEAVGEPLHLIGEPPASVKDFYEKQPVSAPLPVSLCEPWSPADGLPVCLRVGRGRLGDRPGLAPTAWSARASLRSTSSVPSTAADRGSSFANRPARERHGDAVRRRWEHAREAG